VSVYGLYTPNGRRQNRGHAPLWLAGRASDAGKWAESLSSGGDGGGIMRNKGGLITAVIDDSPAAKVGITAGDRLWAINGEAVVDLIDYQYQQADEFVDLELERPTGERYSVTVIKDADQGLGLSFEDAVFDGIRQCRNRCSFCFLDQLPKRMRRSLYLRDDDYRLSFYHGNFVTMTNWTPANWRRVYDQNLSPLNISVHTTNGRLRAQMLAHPRGSRIKRQLNSLTDHGIQFFAQIVLCPELNDGRELEKTIKDLLSYYPALINVAIVPLGLTKHHKQAMTPTTPEWCRSIIEQAGRWQAHCLETYGHQLIYLGDEFYLQGGMPLPPAKHYGEFPLAEDGVGVCRLFEKEFRKLAKSLPEALDKPRRVTVITGRMAAAVLKPAADRLNRIDNLQVELVPVVSDFWGERITATGLITGSDLMQALAGRDLGDLVLMPKVMLRSNGDLFLDSIHIDEVRQSLPVPLQVVPTNAAGLIAGALQDDSWIDRESSVPLVVYSWEKAV
jgi:putative radical SAM enzyme (TIGR03279 family)